ncbi:hypothetical protein [Rhizobium aegyptiacum]|uniref:hypothetical protein n=1 Tax=Rhizobium aegyptiacum TaxID=1764550 RepID=UPI0012E7CA06|nr:hypothetical protein [Rhizobium aegyptiacum]
MDPMPDADGMYRAVEIRCPAAPTTAILIALEGRRADAAWQRICFAAGHPNSLQLMPSRCYPI